MTTFIRKAVQVILDLLFPPVCPFCGRVYPDGICPRCRAHLPVVQGAFCLKCGQPLEDSSQEYCDDCAHVNHTFEQGRALYPHKDPMKKAVYELKYDHCRIYGEIFGRELAAHYAGWIRDRRITMIVPIPLHKKRLAERGYNQAAVIAKALWQTLAGACDDAQGCREDVPEYREDVLLRTHKTTRLKNLDRKGRRTALGGAFTADLTHVSADKRRNILLIDDIYTTGSTVDEAAACLKRAGAHKIYFLTVTIGQGR